MNEHSDLDQGRLFEAETAAPELPPYEAPRVVTYRGDDVLQLLPPAQACSFGHSVVACATPTPFIPKR